MVGKGSVNHNSREFNAKNTDPQRTHLNTEYCNEDIKEALEALEVDIGEIKELKSETDNTGRVYKLTIVGTDGEHVLKNSGTAGFFGTYGVLSNKYTVTPYGEDRKELYAKSFKEKKQLNAYHVIDASGEIIEISMPFTILSQKGKSGARSVFDIPPVMLSQKTPEQLRKEIL